jgi:hypothetical protein
MYFRQSHGGIMVRRNRTKSRVGMMELRLLPPRWSSAKLPQAAVDTLQLA